MKTLIFVIGLLFAAMPAWAVDNLTPLASQQCVNVGSCAFGGKNLKAVSVNWPSSTTARYLFIFDATTVPANGTVAQCSASHVTGCWLDCEYSPHSTTGPSGDSYDYGSAPLAGQFGIVVAYSTGASCTSFTLDSADNFIGQAR